MDTERSLDHALHGKGDPDYATEERLVLNTHEHIKAISDDTRLRILGILTEHAATVTQLATSLDQPKGTIGYHVKKLEAAGLIHVVKTRQVRGLTERYYGRVAQRFELSPPDTAAAPVPWVSEFLERALRAAMPTPFDSDLPQFALVHARIPADRAREFAERIVQIAEEFKGSEQQDEELYGFIGGVFRSDRPSLVEDPDVT